MQALRVIDERQQRCKPPMQAADEYSVSRATIMRWARKYGALIKDGRIVRIDMERLRDGLAQENY